MGSWGLEVGGGCFGPRRVSFACTAWGGMGWDGMDRGRNAFVMRGRPHAMELSEEECAVAVVVVEWDPPRRVCPQVASHQLSLPAPYPRICEWGEWSGVK